MLSLSQPRALTRSLSALLGVVLAAPLLASGASAQTAPVIGDHYAARASDTGFAGAVNSSGGYSASVPLDLPAARGGLPIPLQVVHGGNRFGAAGIGWDVPLSFIQFNRASNGSANQNVAYHRPLASGDAAPQGRDFATLTLDGSTTDLVRNAASTAWVGLRGSQQLEVRDGVSGTLELYDGNGLKYVFSSDGRSSDGTSIGPLDAGNYYLLSDVFGPSGTNVHLAYNFGAPGLGGGSTGLSIDLASVSYNYATATACAKHQVSLVYDTDAIAPLSLSLFGSTVLIRQHKLTAVDVTARENDCSGAVKSLRKYNFTYQDDPDIGQPRLHQVTMIGQEGTDERALTLPVATYSYGRFTGSDGKVAYRVTQTITLPEDFTTIDDGMAGVSSTTTTGGSGAFTLKGLFDVDGDNRPDLVYGHVQNQVDSFGTTGGRLARNRPASDGIGTIFTDAGFLNPVAPAPPGILPKPLPFISGVGVNGGVPGVDSHGHPDIGHTVRGKVTTQLIDMNGDGRLDIVVSDGTEESRHNWLVYLNAPDPASINGISWQPRTISTAPIVQRLIDAGFLSQFDHTAGDFLPLSRSSPPRPCTCNLRPSPLRKRGRPPLSSGGSRTSMATAFPTSSTTARRLRRSLRATGYGSRISRDRGPSWH